MAKPSRVFIFFQCIICIGILGLSWQLYTRSLSNHYEHAEHGAKEITSFINHHLQLCRDGITRMRPEIIATNGDTARVIQLMNEAVDGAYNWGLRFGWSNDQKQLIAGSVIGRIDPPYDLSQRNYVNASFADPGTPHFDIVNHIIFERPILIMAMGITMPKGKYLGTLAALLDITTMNEALLRMALEHRVEILIQSNKGAFIFSNIETYTPYAESEIQLVSDHEYVTVFARPPRDEVEALQEHYLIFGIGLLVGFMIISRYLYRLYLAKWASPLKHLAHILNEATGEAVVLKPESGYDINEVVEKASHIKAIIHASQNLQTEREAQAEQLREALSIIQSFQHEQASFFQSFSVEVEQVADTLEEYLANVSHVKDAHADIARKYNIASQLPDMDTAYPVEDANEHMRYLSQCFLLMCEDISDPATRKTHYQGDAQSHKLHDIYEEALAKTASHHEERVVTIEGDATLELASEKQVMCLTVLASLYMAHRYVAHDAALTITFNNDAKTVCISGHSDYRPPRYAAQEFFDMPVAENTPDRIAAHLNSDIHAYIMRYFLRNMGGRLQLACTDQQLEITMNF